MESWQDGSRYEGGYKEGMKHGHGKYIWNDGSMYEGEWFENKINGSGIYIWPDGRKYNGEWKENNMHGKGVHTWKDGRMYGSFRMQMLAGMNVGMGSMPPPGMMGGETLNQANNRVQ